MYSFREFKISTLPLHDLVLGECGKTLIKIRGNILDVGSICYLKRSSETRKKGLPRLVELSSYCKEREGLVLKLIRVFSIKVRRHPYCDIRDFLIFVNWCDRQETLYLLDDNQSIKNALKKFTDWMVNEIASDRNSPNYFAKIQSGLIRTLSDLFNEDFGRGLRRIRRSSRYIKNTDVPAVQIQAKCLSVLGLVFHNFSNFVVNNMEYPFYFTGLRGEVNGMWVFPALIKFQSPLKTHEVKHGTRVFDYEGGKIRSPEGAAALYEKPKSAERVIYIAKKALKNANADMRHPQRRDLAGWAYKSFVWLFLANTGMNYSSVVNIPWDPNYEVSTSRQGFRSIKFRAGGKEVSFEVGSKFLPDFKLYLKLREYLLNGRSFHNLFFDVCDKMGRGICELQYPPISQLKDFYKSIDPEFEMVLSREWRQAKSDFILNVADISTAATMLQNKESTVRKHYASGSDSQWKLEWNQFFSLLGPAIKRRANEYKHKSSALAHCSSFGNPESAPGIVDVPSCETEHGCLDCAKFRIHADEKDVRKLCSARLYIAKISIVNPSFEFFNETYSLPLEKINFILNEISSVSEKHKAMVDRVEAEVRRFESIDPYWELKFSMLFELGVL